MPTIVRYCKLIFFLVAGDLNEPYHLHVVNKKGKRGKSAKIWITENGAVIKEYKNGRVQKGELTEKEINQAIKIINNNIEYIKEEIDNFKRGEKVRTLIIK